MRFTVAWRYGVPALFVFPFGTILLTAARGSSSRDAVAAALLVLLWLLGGLHLVVMSREVFRVTGAAVERTSPWTRRRVALRWQDVTVVELAGTRLIMRGSGRTLKVPLAADGSCEFAARALSALPAGVLESGVQVRPRLEGMAAYYAPEGAGPEVALPTVRRRQWLVGLAALLLAGAAVVLWGMSSRLEVPVRFAVPSGWIDLSAEALDQRHAAILRQVRSQPHVADLGVFAVEPSREEGGDEAPAFVATIHDGELDVSQIAKVGAATLKGVRTNFPDATAAVQRLEQVGGAPVVHLEFSSSAGGLIVYVVPLGARTAALMFTCGAPACGRIQSIAADSVKGTRGITAPVSLARYGGPMVRAAAMVLLFTSLFAATTVVAGRWGTTSPSAFPGT